MSSSVSPSPPFRPRGTTAALLLTLLLLMLLSSLTPVSAMITSSALRMMRKGNTYSYAMYNGTSVSSESFYTGYTTYPYVFNEEMNKEMVSLLKSYLGFSGETLDSVGGDLDLCMSATGKDSTGKTCYKTALAVASPANCPSKNILCCPLFWRVGTQSMSTTMSEMDPQTVFWNGVTVVNGLYANFSEAYLQANDNCSVPLFNGSADITLAVDATGAWRFVPLVSSFVLQETVLNVDANAAVTYFGNSNPQKRIAKVAEAQMPGYKVIKMWYIPVAVCSVLLFIVALFLLLTYCCSVRGSNERVHQRQRRILYLSKAPNTSANSSAAAKEVRSLLSKVEAECETLTTNSSDSVRSSQRGSNTYGDLSDDSEEDEMSDRTSSYSDASDGGCDERESSSRGMQSRPLPGVRARRVSADVDSMDSPSPPYARRANSTNTVVHRMPNTQRQSKQRYS